MQHPTFRSKLFVPGSRPERFAKALASGADAVSFDLEDAVLPEARPQARLAVAEALDHAAPSGPWLIVRVNAPGTADFEADLRAVVRQGLDCINLPKVDGVDTLRQAVADLERHETAAGLGRPIALLVNIETPAAMRRAAELGAASARVAGLQLGLADLFEPLGIDRRDAANVHAALFTLRLAAAAAGVPAYDAAWPDLADPAGLEVEARLAQRLGFAGKSCIHPRQVPVVNAVFAPSPEALAWARRVVDAAAAHGQGAFALDGRMIDAPFIARAQAMLSALERRGRSA